MFYLLACQGQPASEAGFLSEAFPNLISET
jgi:hypothetical protein